jgi:hypothetical protein
VALHARFSGWPRGAARVQLLNMISELRYAMRSAPTVRPIGQQRAETRAHAGGGNGREWDGILFQVWCVSQLMCKATTGVLGYTIVALTARHQVRIRYLAMKHPIESRGPPATRSLPTVGDLGPQKLWDCNSNGRGTPNPARLFVNMTDQFLIRSQVPLFVAKVARVHKFTLCL